MSSFPSGPWFLDERSDSGARYPMFVTSWVHTFSNVASVVATQSGMPSAGATSAGGGASPVEATQCTHTFALQSGDAAASVTDHFAAPGKSWRVSLGRA